MSLRVAWAAIAQFVVVLLLASGCAGAGGSDAATEFDRADPDGAVFDVSVETSAHRRGPCTGSFVAHDLAHTTRGAGGSLDTFDATGAGVAAGDLDGDGDSDLILANLSGPTRILENTGRPHAWVAHDLIEARFRGAAAVDYDGDGDLDIVLTTGIGPPVPFENSGAGPLGDRFERTRFDGVRAATYSMAWGDLGGDGDLDLVTGSYNAELTILRNSPVLGSDTGVIVHEATADGFSAERLSADAQALAAMIVDIDGDDRADIVIGNDLATPDFVFLAAAGGGDTSWDRVEPFTTTSYSTMSLDAADIDGDGHVELYATDMAPLPHETDDDWREVLADLEAAPKPDDVQTPQNVLNSRRDGSWSDQAPTLGLEATGWSWSGLFGDLDNDGNLDLYVVNGMQSDSMFGHLQGSRLVEANQAFRATSDGFDPAPDWGLADEAGGRGAVMFDADGDGDLDIVVNNLEAPARLYENQVCGGSALTVELDWPDSRNTRALGATVVVTPSEAGAASPSAYRLVGSSRGYLSAEAPVVHFGLGDAEGPLTVEIRWPDGATSTVTGVMPDTHLRITRPA